MKNSIPPTVVTLLLAVSSLSAAMHYVSLESRNPTPPYTDWVTAATSIQDAVNVVTTNDVIVVTNGVYPGGVTVVKPLTLQSVNGPEATVIDGGSTVRCVFLTNGACLVGFTLAHGVAENGGGVYCPSASAVLSNCVLTGNVANGYDGFGGGALGGTLNNCTLSGNYSAFDGGGVSGEWDGCILNNCTLTGNSAAYFGGGAQAATLNNCTLTGNLAADGGGTFFGTLNNCTLNGNWAGVGGGAFGGTLNNCTLTGNSAGGYGGGAAACTLYNCIAYFNTAGQGANYDPYGYSTLDYSCTTPLPTNGVGNITRDPLFVSYANGNVRLQPNSPCINAGNNAYVTTVTDLDGNPRVAGGTVDIGAYEYQTPAIQIPPQTQTAEAGSAVGLWVEASGSAPLFYAWCLNGTNFISCSTNRELALPSVQSAQAGAYSVVVSNVLGAVTSAPAMLQVIAPVERRPVPGVEVMGQAGNVLNLDCADFLRPAPNWTTLGSVNLTGTSQYYFDLTLPLAAQRFYRAQETADPPVLTVLDLHIVPALTVTGSIGDSVRVDAINQFGPADAWFTLDTVTLTNTSQLYFDTSAWRQPPRLYRLVEGP